MTPRDSLRIAILSRNAQLYSTKRLLTAAKKRGHSCHVRDTLQFGMFVEHAAPQLTYRGRNFSPVDVIIPRIGGSISFYGHAVVRQFEQMGVFSLNSSNGLTTARDKLRSLQVLSRHDIGIATSAFVQNRRDILPAIKRVGGAPVIIKLLAGTQGMGVILADTEKVAETIIETLQITQQNVLIQKFVAESKGRDIRAFVVGDRVVAAMRRRAVGSEFRSNVHRGGKTEPVELPAEYERTAVRAAHIIGLRVAGVDMLEGKDGPVIMEVNASPGLEGIEGATGVDVAGEIIDYLAEHVRFSDLDLRQRLSFARGYAVAEFPIVTDSPLAGKPLSESGLRERDIVVMSIDRNGQHFPVPRGSDVLVAGDLLLCYGPKITLREFLPHLKETSARKRKRKSTSP
ncbi:MAG: RimK family alpha-L-glutamate ligase [Opitutales bacterium]|nr:RimK family alpha-L-glutamate ligase [Opitutales bacterium]